MNDISWLSPHSQGLVDARTSKCAHSSQGIESLWIPPYTSNPHSKTGYWAEQKSRSNRTDACSRRDSIISKSSDSCHPLGGSPEAVKCNRPSLSLETKVFAWNTVNANTASRGKRKIPYPVSSPVDASERFALDRFEHPDLEVDTKRRKLAEPAGWDAHMNMDEDALIWQDTSEDSLHAHLVNITTGLMGEAQTSPISDSPCWFQKLENGRVNSTPKTYAAALAGIKHTTFPWRSREEIRARSVSRTSSSHVDEITPPATARATTSSNTGSLTQERIQYNYQEFENRKTQKAAEKAYYTANIPGFDGVVSPTDENDKIFERIFLEGSDAGD
jgi:hypothetical protein